MEVIKRKQRFVRSVVKRGLPLLWRTTSRQIIWRDCRSHATNVTKHSGQEVLCVDMFQYIANKINRCNRARRHLNVLNKKFCSQILCVIKLTSFIKTWHNFFQASAFNRYHKIILSERWHVPDRWQSRNRLGVCRDRRDRRSCKIFVSCVNFSRKQHSFLHILQVYTHLNVNFLQNC